GRTAGLRLDLHGLEEAKRAQSLAGRFDQEAIKGVALGEAELTPDDVILGTEIADDVDALDIDARAFVDTEGDVHNVVRLVTIEAWLDLTESVTLQRYADGQRLDRLLHLFGIVDAPGLGEDVTAEMVDVERRQRALDVDGAEPVARAFVDGESNEEAAAVTVEIRGGRQDTHIGIAAL